MGSLSQFPPQLSTHSRPRFVGNDGMKEPLQEACCPTVQVLRAVVGLVDGRAEALVAAAAADHVRPGPVERELVLAHLGHRRLQALQGAGLFQSQSGAEVLAGRFWKRKANGHLFPTSKVV